MSGEALLTGRVERFDDASGLGTVVSPAGDSYPFHCVEIADGSRRIDAGVAVAFIVLAKLGDDEATQLSQVTV